MATFVTIDSQSNAGQIVIILITAYYMLCEFVGAEVLHGIMFDQQNGKSCCLARIVVQREWSLADITDSAVQNNAVENVHRPMDMEFKADSFGLAEVGSLTQFLLL